ncbi:ribonuclease HII [Psychrobacillus sp. BL-248-WT-3]|uniref:ribonuclease HII n=1 Tax=Psychrobacillus sp. BL-248-WT-3 TaxID=2725306 RepID=UPI00146BFA73|nr:ribonuclease HII [Psychrobacillus sp. BL-248-WT-3]NME04819.1 ribonuclease HII [Psychrobacillus sp. BL-248-WT-3]
MLRLQEIKEKLIVADGTEDWFKELEEDQRAGAKKLLESWKRKQQVQKLEKEAHIEKVMFDKNFVVNRSGLIAGVDEAGRGPLAGPVVTAAVILREDTNNLIGLNDSKQISRAKRNELAMKIKENAISYFIHFQSVEKIDTLNIYEATKQSMSEAVLSLKIQPSVVLVDAMKLPIDIENHSLIKGDAKSLAIAAASILAKTARDEYMDKLHEEYPVYLFNKHAGYGTKEHIAMIMQHGPSEHHRKTFEPIKSILKSEVKV